MAQQGTAPTIRASKGGTPIVMVTAYDAPTARIADDAGVDIILVGDSVAMVVLGYDDTLQVTVADMAHHVGAVARARPRALVVADMPWLSYHLSVEDAVRNAAQLIRAGAAAVKLEGGRARVAVVEALVDAQIPVMGHLGLTPQSVHAMGGYKVQGQQAESAATLVDDAHALAGAGCFAIVLECVPREVARLVTAEVPVPTIGIGAGPDCDGQVLVLHDLLGLEDRPLPKFVRRYATAKADAVAAVSAYAADVRAGAFPSDAESYHLSDEVAASLRRRSAHGVNIRILRWVIVGLLVVGGVAFLAVGANSPADPSFKADNGPVSLKRTPFGDFTEIGFRIEGGCGPGHRRPLRPAGRDGGPAGPGPHGAQGPRRLRRDAVQVRHRLHRRVLHEGHPAAPVDRLLRRLGPVRVHRRHDALHPHAQLPHLRRRPALPVGPRGAPGGAATPGHRAGHPPRRRRRLHLVSRPVQSRVCRQRSFGDSEGPRRVHCLTLLGCWSP